MKPTEVHKLSTEALYQAVLNYFDIRELVSPGVYQKYCERFGWPAVWILARFDIRLLRTLLFVRLKKGQPITVNNWLWGGRFDERGLRDTSTPMAQKRAANNEAWLSMHPLAGAIDYDVEGETASEHRDWLESVADELPHPIRLENKMNGKQISWVHLDVADIPGNPKVYRFNI